MSSQAKMRRSISSSSSVEVRYGHGSARIQLTNHLCRRHLSGSGYLEAVHRWQSGSGATETLLRRCPSKRDQAYVSRRVPSPFPVAQILDDASLEQLKGCRRVKLGAEKGQMKNRAIQVDKRALRSRTPFNFERTFKFKPLTMRSVTAKI